MLESLTDRMSKAVRNLRGIGKLTEENMAEALGEVRQALLSADVHFKVAKQFIEEVKAECLGTEVIKSVAPGQQVVKIIHDQLVKTLGGEVLSAEQKEALSEEKEKEAEVKKHVPPASKNKPQKIMMVGLHGSGKTTSSVKLANFYKKQGHTPALVACDVYRPAAIDQLEALSKAEGFGVYADRESKDVPKIGKKALSWAKDQEATTIIFDTAGRLQIDEDLVEEIKRLKETVKPDEVFLVADSALGQEAVNVAKHFHEAVALTGIILTKLDGDARGGAALSMKSVTEVPIKYIGIGEKIENFDLFHPERLAQRILGMGDVVSLVEKAKEAIDEDEAKALAKKLQRAEFNFDDFLSQLKSLKKMGSMASIAAMVPGMNKMNVGDREEGQLKRTEAIILSMTRRERTNPHLINGSRRLRIANGSGTKVKDVNQLLKQFQQMKKMMKSMKGAKGKKMQKQMAAQGGDMSKLAGLGL